MRLLSSRLVPSVASMYVSGGDPELALDGVALLLHVLHVAVGVGGLRVCVCVCVCR